MCLRKVVQDCELLLRIIKSTNYKFKKLVAIKNTADNPPKKTVCFINKLPHSSV